MPRQAMQIDIPDNISFADLKLTRDSDGMISFDWNPIERMCVANRIPVGVFIDGPEDNVCSLIVQWYAAHRKAGGAPDPVAEDLLTEVRFEDAAGQLISLPPGTA